MLASAPGTLVKETNMKTLHWKMMKNEMFHFMKVKKLLFLTFLTSILGTPVNMTQKMNID